MSKHPQSVRFLSWLVAIPLALAVTLAVGAADACDPLSPASRSEWCDPPFVPRLPEQNPNRILWVFASHDERRDYLVMRGVPAHVANKIAIGGVPLSGQARADHPGWLLTPQAAAFRLRALF
jgi:hypothetical protein